MIDLWDIKPHQVSRNLKGYSVFFYGEPKSGKTTTATKFPNSLLLAFEKGYSTLANIMVDPINSWAEFRKVLRQLKDERSKEMFETIIVDTADIAYDYCTKYILDTSYVFKDDDIMISDKYVKSDKEILCYYEQDCIMKRAKKVSDYDLKNGDTLLVF